jgi:hypothetical protein
MHRVRSMSTHARANLADRAHPARNLRTIPVLIDREAIQDGQ